MIATKDGTQIYHFGAPLLAQAGRRVLDPSVVREGWVVDVSDRAQHSQSGNLPCAIFLQERKQGSGFVRAVSVEFDLPQRLGVRAPEGRALGGHLVGEIGTIGLGDVIAPR